MSIFFVTSKIIVYLHCEYNVYVNMKVYLLVEDYISSVTNILGVFSSREKADSVMSDLLDRNPGSLFYVSEFEVDEWFYS